MSRGNDQFFNFMIFLVATAGVIGAVLYGIFLFLPYVVFYILPFLFLSTAIGLSLRGVITQFANANGGRTEENHYDGHHFRTVFQYKNLLFIFPLMILLTLVVFEVNSAQRVKLDQQGNEVGVYLEWPKAHKAFNNWRTSTYESSPFDGLKKAAKVEVLYDRRQIGWIVWLALFFGGPLFCLWLSLNDEDEEGRRIAALIDACVREKRELLEARILDQDKIVEAKVAKYQEQIQKLKDAHEALVDENRQIKASLEFSPGGQRPLAELGKKGVLDSDLF